MIVGFPLKIKKESEKFGGMEKMTYFCGVRT